jgi:hypothetical protein
VGLVQESGAGQFSENKRGIVTRKRDKAAKTRGMLFFWLVKSATIRPHPDVMPANQAIMDEVKRAVAQIVMRST